MLAITLASSVASAWPSLLKGSSSPVGTNIVFASSRVGFNLGHISELLWPFYWFTRMQSLVNL